MYNSSDGLKAGKNFFFTFFIMVSREGTRIFYVVVLIGKRKRREMEEKVREGKKRGHLKKGL